jgi:hypothetical protein
MAVAFDAVSTALSSTNSITGWNHTCTGSDRVLYVCVALDGASNFTILATYNGVSMTEESEITTDRFQVVFRLINPASGTNEIAVTGLPSGVQQVGIAFSVNGVDQTTPNDAMSRLNQASGTSITQSVTTAAGDLLVSFVAVDSTTGLTSGQTIPSGGTYDGTSSEYGVNYTTGTGSTAIAWSWTSSVANVQTAFNINASASSGNAPRALHQLMQQGIA